MLLEKETERIGLFHVPILKSKLDLDHKEIELYVRDRLKDIDAYTTYYDDKLNKSVVKDMPQREEFEHNAKQLALQWLKMRGVDLKKVKDNASMFYWFSVYTEGERHTLHQHPGAAVAGTYYPYADKDSVPIRFKNPASNVITMSEPYLDATDNIFHFHHPKTGDINVWPPWLEHEIGRQGAVPESRARIAISFNFSRTIK